MAADGPSKPAPKPADPKPAGPPPGSPQFASLTEVMRALERFSQADVELDAAICEDIERFFAAPLPTGDTARAVAWLDEAEVHIKDFRDSVDAMAEELLARQVDFDPSAIKAALLTDPQNAVRNELNALKGTRFAGERADWRRRIDDNLTALRDKQERQAAKLRHVVVDLPDGRVAVRPTPEWWAAYTAWHHTAFDGWRKHLGALLDDRWRKFVDKEVKNVATPLDASFSVELPPVNVDDVPDPTQRRRDPVHYRDGGIGLADSTDEDMKAPEEVFDPTTGGSRNAASLSSMVQRFGTVAVAPLGMMFSNVAVKIVSTAVVLGVGLFVNHLVTKREVDRGKVDRVAKASAAIQKSLIEDYRKRLDRHRVDVERFVRAYGSVVQQAVLDRLTLLVDAELRRRTDLVPEEKKKMTLRQKEIQRRQTLLAQVSGDLTNKVLVDLAMRRRALRDELAKQRPTG